MKYTNELEQFKREVDDVFTFEVDNRQVGFNGNELIQRIEFWEEVYTPRINEEIIFDEFLKSDCPLLFCTGHVGSGKSTFLREKYEQGDKIEGAIIDYRRKASEFRTEDKNEVLDKILFSIKETYEMILITNIKYMIHNDESELIDRFYNLHIEIKQISGPEWEDAILIRKAKRELATQIIYNSQSNHEIYKYTSDNKLFGKSKSVMIERIREHFIENENEVQNILSMVTSAVDLIRLYRILFGDTQKTHLITIDNIDAISLKEIKNCFLECMINLENVINRNSDFPYVNLSFSPIKIALSVRDGNISRLSKTGAAAKRDMQIKFAKEDYEIKTTKVIKTLLLSPDLAYEIIIRRLRILKRCSSNREIFKVFEKIVYNFWLDKSLKTINKKFGYINVAELCNDSIRLMLDHIAESTYEIIEKYLNIVDLSELFDIAFSYKLIKGLFINTLWLHTSTNEVLLQFKKSVNDEILTGKDYCCSFRMILTFLSNQVDSTSKTENLILVLKKYFNYSSKKIKETLFYLFDSEYKDSELITIYQNKFIDRWEDIDINGDVRLNSKGRIFLEKLTTQIDYFGTLTEGDHGLVNKSIVELSPTLALEYIKAIYKVVDKLYMQHKKYYSEYLLPILKEFNQNIPFDSYHPNFCKGNDFYIERVAQSHITSIKYFIRECLKGNDAKLLYKPSEQYVVDFSFDMNDEFFKSNPSSLEEDILFEKYLNQLPPQHVINKIWGYIRKYEEIVEKMQQLKNRT